MTIELYMKLAALAAILIIALAFPILSALVVTGGAAWRFQDISVCEIALVQKVLDLIPPGIKTICMDR